VGDISLLVYESRAKFFNSSSKLYTAFPKTVEKLNRLEERGCALGSPWDTPQEPYDDILLDILAKWI